MKKIFTLFILHIFILPLLVFAGSFDTYVSIFSQGDAQSIGRKFDEMTELNIKGKVGTYSVTHATTILKDFFDANTPSSFVLEHESQLENNTEFAIGKLNTQTGTFKVSLFIKNSNGNSMIKELRIE